ncbi:MAG: bifunctional 5,10-methylene-tetrahydrofolate dehydrogenase/5,10-methylene-tetrahydrofolate cyclohydrolase [Nitrospirae bacterium RIFCSPHIGHO2_01_FULL_66_17]|nr:MAG: bifunctional 5,10-methylene-tetrahydrofolate dehydrogenase/5,10-methylene-tetrahydrofolate cyclohydrolase [Nitrospirae bacterium RIFCSPHIGHO2_01_FULL_66_17]
MSAQLIDGKVVAKAVKEEVRSRVEALKARGIRPGLATVLVGDDPASHVYVRNKQRTCEELGMHSVGHNLPATTSQVDVLALIDRLNRDPAIHGILVQLPLPKPLRSEPILYAVSPDKDVDGLHPVNVGKLMMGEPRFVPCTPAGIMAMLDYYKLPIEGKTAVVVGRSNLVGKPVAMLLLHRHATVTICHSKTPDLAEVCRRADILVAAVGKARFIRGEMVKEGAVVIDVGINRQPDGKLVGDVDFEAVAAKASWITPVPGGVGPMTIAMLMQNTMLAASTT